MLNASSSHCDPYRLAARICRTGRYGNAQAREGSFWLNTGRPDHLAPFLRFLGNQLVALLSLLDPDPRQHLDQLRMGEQEGLELIALEGVASRFRHRFNQATGHRLEQADSAGEIARQQKRQNPAAPVRQTRAKMSPNRG